MIRRHIIFHGHVQGVGFRYRSAMMANELGLTGWVQNLYDGTVEMEVQGKSLLISRLIRELQNDRYIEITDMECEAMPLKEHEGRFRY
ncbi:MAG: acylphosphatase [Lachnospiraceae bacterium]|nr:acylphosphatase [Lachnospiraceae bacterium]